MRKLWGAAAAVAGLTAGMLAMNITASDAEQVVARATLVDIRGTEVGTARFVTVKGGAVVAKVAVTIDNAVTANGSDFHGFHIHANSGGAGCITKPASTNPAEWFTEVGGHWDDGTNAHGAHLGDNPSLLRRADGTATVEFTVDKYLTAQLPGKALVVHFAADDFGKHPGIGNSATAGNAGARYACGLIESTAANG